LAASVLAGLGAAHAEGIVHRDVKPGNVLLADDGSFKIGDFGIAASLDASDTVTRVPLGTPAYTAPERLRGERATACSDLFSLGVVLYEAAAGARPFVGESPSTVAEAIVVGSHVPLRERRPDLPLVLVSAIERALATEPADRFADAQAMGRALDASPGSGPVTATVPFAASVGATATLPPPAPRRSGGRSIARRSVVLGVVALVVVLALALAVVATRGDGGPSAADPTLAPTLAPTPAPTSVSTGAAPVDGAPVPEPLAVALDRLDRATQP
jgi:non-specific serine/threonine protein kinase/serine/threonine-protein kinase